MEAQTLEFNTIRTVGTINKDGVLKKVYEKKFGEHNHQILRQKAINNQLANDAIEFLKNVFEDVISKKQDLVEIYNKIELESKTPRRYGKSQIQKDITAQGGTATPLQNCMLSLAKLKTLNCNLLDKGVSDRYKGTNKLSDSDLRTINAAVRDFEKKIEKILSKS